MKYMAIGLLLACTCLTAGCADTGAASDESTVASSSSRFTGPWAAAFSTAYRNATSPEERAALRDGIISDQEYNYFFDKVRTCMTQVGASDVFLIDGEWEYSRPDSVSEKAIDRCLSRDGVQILSLRDSIERNPSHRDENEIMSNCLQREKLVPPSYGAAEYARDTSSGSYPFSLDSDGFASCLTDPIGRAGD